MIYISYCTFFQVKIFKFVQSMIFKYRDIVITEIPGTKKANTIFLKDRFISVLVHQPFNASV